MMVMLTRRRLLILLRLTDYNDDLMYHFFRFILFIYAIYRCSFDVLTVTVHVRMSCGIKRPLTYLLKIMH